jgi:probable DNA metabolism protein
MRTNYLGKSRLSVVIALSAASVAFAQKDRDSDQKWMIFDLKRHYGIFYDLKEVHFFTPDSSQLQNFRNPEQFHHEEEKKYQTLWQRYFVKTGIPERKNMKLHIQWVPKRYWKYLTEKY